MVFQKLPMVFTNCLLKGNRNSSNTSGCSGSGSNGSSVTTDDEMEQVYWENLVSKAINDDADEVSSTQDESEVSSYVWCGENAMVVQPAAVVSRDEPAPTIQEEHPAFLVERVEAPLSVSRRPPQEAVMHDDDDIDNIDDFKTTHANASSEMAAALMPMVTVPFVSLDVQWEGYCESTELAPDVTLADAAARTYSRSSVAFWTPSGVSTRQPFVSATATIPSQIYIRAPPLSLAVKDDCFTESAAATVEAKTTAAGFTEIDNEILDPTEPLLYGRGWKNRALLSEELRDAAAALHGLLARHWRDPGCTALHAELVACLRQHPTACQVRYPRPTGAADCGYPLAHFCETGCLAAVQAAYAAFPEAIGCGGGGGDSAADTSRRGHLPLARACQNAAAGSEVVAFLLRAFPDAIRRTNDRDQTPLHLACRLERPDPAVVQLLLDYYPAAAQLPDQSGYTPLLTVCQTARNAAVLLPLLISTSPLAVSAVTGNMEKALHVAAGADLTVIELLLEQDPTQCRCTDDFFQLPLHRAVLAYCDHDDEQPNSAERGAHPTTRQRQARQQRILDDNIALLVWAHPAAAQWTDVNGETPGDIGVRKLGLPRCAALLARLQPPPLRVVGGGGGAVSRANSDGGDEPPRRGTLPRHK